MQRAVEPNTLSMRPALRAMPAPGFVEARPGRAVFLVVALAVAAAYGFFLLSYWAPAPSRPGIDENAYLVAGRNIAEHGTPGFKPADDFLYVGAMWVRTNDQTFEPPRWLPGFVRGWLTVHTEGGWYYPKYPAGLPLLNAIAIRLGGGGFHGREAAFLVGPVCTAAAVLGMFFLTRAIVGASFEGVLAMIVLAALPTALELAEVPGSHGPAVGFVVWGMYFLVRWWQTGRWWQGAAAGFLLGYAVTIRYSEALLLFPFYPLDQILSDTDLGQSFNSAGNPHLAQLLRALRLLPVGPLGLAALFSIRWRRPVSYVKAAVPVVAWAVPVGVLVTLNWFSMGHLTGYDTTNESAAFTSGELLKKWAFTVHEVYLYGLFLFLPLGVAGMVMLFRASWRAGLLLATWFVPGTVLYMSYYWGMQAPGIGFLRFFLSLFPPLIVAAMWLLRSAAVGAVELRGAGRPAGQPEGGEKSRGALDEAIDPIGDASKARQGEWAAPVGAGVPGRRGSVAAPLGAGLLTAGAAAVGLYVSLPNVERQHRGNMNLHYSARETVAGMRMAHGKPTTRPILIADDGLFPMHLQYLQFMVDADCYTADAYEPRAGGGFGLLGLFQGAAANGNDAQKPPVLIQPERIEYMTAVRRGVSSEDLVRAQHRLWDAALSGGRPVYAVLTAPQAGIFRDRFVDSAYEMVERSKWAEPCAVRFPAAPQGARNGPPGEDRSPNRLAPPVFAGEPLIRWQPVALTLYEIQRRGEGTRPAGEKGP